MKFVSFRRYNIHTIYQKIKDTLLKNRIGDYVADNASQRERQGSNPKENRG